MNGLRAKKAAYSVFVLGTLFVLILAPGCRDETIPYRQEDHGTFNEEWAPHEDVNGWWYLTGYLHPTDNPEQIYSFQYTVLHFDNLRPLPRMYATHLAFTDLQNEQHFFNEKFSLVTPKVYANSDTVSFLPMSLLTRGNDSMDLFAKVDNFEVNLDLSMGKGAFWHGDDGVLVMGVPDDPVQRTVYYSYTNMPAVGEVVTYDDSGSMESMQVTGKMWLDRQWGPYRILKVESRWEWFSIRFFDDEEVMLFAFPQDDYYDGTYIDAEGERSLLRDYSYTPIELIEVDGVTFSYGWDVHLPGTKEEYYRIDPLTDCQINASGGILSGVYFGLIAGVYNDEDELVGYAFVELLPGVRG